MTYICSKSFLMRIRNYYVLLVILALVMLSSCVSREKIVYFQNIEKLGQNSSMAKPSLTIKANDLLGITVSAASLEAVRPFNVVAEARPPAGGVDYGSNSTQQLGYLVDNDGNINFPELGIIHVEGLTPRELVILLTDKLTDYLKDPIVNVRMLNFNVSVLGEVQRPGTFQVTGEKISITEALGLAGDLTIYGRRDNVLVIRDNGGTKNYAYLDFRNADFLNSEYYYLKQNDVVYVEPNGAQRQAASFNRNSTVFISIASLILSVVVLITK